MLRNMLVDIRPALISLSILTYIGHAVTIPMENENSSEKSLMLFDFTTVDNLANWEEQSDTVQEVGMSKAAFVLQKTRIFQRAIFFTLVNPQPNGAGFAGVRTRTQLDLEGYSMFQIEMRGQGTNSGYKVCLRHKGLNEEPHPTYEQKFTAPMDEFKVVELSLADFEPYYRGKKQDPAKVGHLDVKNITNFEFQIYGAVYSPIKQSGTSSLEINWVKAVQ